MNRILRPRLPRSLSSLFSDASLTRKASLNAVSSFIDYGSRLLVALLLTPLLVSTLGAYYYGMWQIAMRTVGYLSPTSGRPTEALKWTLAHDQTSTDYEKKRAYVGSALAVGLLFLPLTLGIGSILVWFVPIWFKAPSEFIWPIRAAVAILVVNMAVTSIAVIPRSVLLGENLAYKRMGMSSVLVFVGGGFTWLALSIDSGIAGVAAAALATTVVTGAFYLAVVRRYAPWFGVHFPPFRETRTFMGLSVWFMIWNLVMTLMMSSDVIILGLLDSVEGAGSYTLTKYAAETTVMIIAMIVFGVTPGLGGIIGSGNRKRAARVRGEIMAISWLLATALGATVLLWNRVFVGLWVGSENYLGTLPSLLIVLVVTQFVLIRNDANIIDLTLKLPVKVSLGFASATLGIALAAAFIVFFDLGVVGMTLGLLIGRSALSVAYPAMIGRFLGVSPRAQIRGTLRPAALTAVLFGTASLLDREQAVGELPFADTWVGFFLFAALTFCALLAVEYVAGFTAEQRRNTVARARSLLQRPGPTP